MRDGRGQLRGRGLGHWQRAASGTRGAARASGFTLLELILAMAITCMLAMTLYATLRTAFRAQASATGAVEALRVAQVAMQMVGKDLSNALPPTGILAGAFYGMPM